MKENNSISHEGTIKMDAYNTYYLRTADHYRLVKWILLLLFTVYLIFMMLLYRESITRENFAYLLRDFNVSAVADGGFASVVYEERQNMIFSEYKGELVVAGMSDIAFYNGTGAVSLKDTTDCRMPVLRSGDKYLLIYDEGGTSYALYTSIARVKNDNTDSAIQTADVSDSGVYAIVTRSREAQYVITLYSASFREIAKYYRDNYVIDVAVSPDGEQFAVLSTSHAESKLYGTLTLSAVGSDSVIDIPLGECMPLQASYLSDGTLAVIAENAVRLYDRNGTEKSVFNLTATTLSFMDVSDSRVALVCREDTLGLKSRVVVIASDGTLVADAAFDEKILNVTASDGETCAYVSTRDTVYTLAPTGEKQPLATYSGKLISLCEIADTPVFCFASGAHAAAQ